MKASLIIFTLVGIVVLFGAVYFYLNWLPFLISNSKFQDNLGNIDRVTVSISEYVSKDEISYRNLDVKDPGQIRSIISLVKDDEIEIPFMSMYETDFETTHWLVQFYTKNHEEMYMVYIDENKIFDKKTENSKLYKYLSNEFN